MNTSHHAAWTATRTRSPKAKGLDTTRLQGAGNGGASDNARAVDRKRVQFPSWWLALAICLLLPGAARAVDPVKSANDCDCPSCPVCLGYPIDVVRIIDGDTIVVNIDVGLGVMLTKQRVRITGYDAWETRRIRGADDEETGKGLAAKVALKMLLDSGKTRLLTTGQRDRYGRRLGSVVVVRDDESVVVADEMKRLGHARPL